MSISTYNRSLWGRVFPGNKIILALVLTTNKNQTHKTKYSDPIYLSELKHTQENTKTQQSP